MEFPLTQPCPQCGAEMEPAGLARRGRATYACPDCGHQTDLAAEPAEPEEAERDDPPA